MKILAFNTANNFCSVALSADYKIVSYRENLNNSIQAEQLIPMIEQTLSLTNISYNEIDWLIVANGPGSFTGIRTGLACAQGILLCSKIQGVAISNFELAYAKVCEQIEHYSKIYVILNAYRAQIYLQIFDFLGTKSKATLIDIDHLIKILTLENSNLTENIVCVGDGLDVIYSHIIHLKNITFLPRFTKIKAHHICKFAHQAIKQQKLNPTSLLPLYIRVPDAKIVS